MILKILGAVLILVGCGGSGFYLVRVHRQQTQSLRQLLSGLEYMECELTCRLTPLPELCRGAARICSGSIAKLFSALAEELDTRTYHDAVDGMYAALDRVKELPSMTHNNLILLGRSLGCFDAEGQLSGLRSVKASCQNDLLMHTQDQDVRLRTYQTLGLCAGAAIVILFV